MYIDTVIDIQRTIAGCGCPPAYTEYYADTFIDIYIGILLV